MSAGESQHTLSVVMPVYNGLNYLRKSLPPLVATRDAALLECWWW